MKKLGLGVVGLSEGRSILSAALASPCWELRNICDLNEELCLKRREEFSFPRHTLRYGELLEDSQIDVVAIYTPDPCHADHVIAALQAGKHVICTKPLFIGLADARRVYDVWRGRREQAVFVGQSSRFFEPMKRQRIDYERGVHGQVLSVESHYNHDVRYYMEHNWGRDGRLNLIYAGLSHPVDLVRWYMPDIQVVHAVGLVSADALRLGQKNPDTVHCVFQSESGRVARASLHGASAHLPPARASMVSCVLHGSRGSSIADYPQLRYAAHFEGEERVESYDETAPYYFRFEGLSHHAGEFQNYLEYFAAEIAEGRHPRPDLREGIITVAVMNAIERSIQSGQPVRVDTLLGEFFSPVELEDLRARETREQDE